MTTEKLWNTVMCSELVIMLALLGLLFALSGCDSLGKVAKPLKGGSASFEIVGSEPKIEATQPENAQAPTVTEWHRDYVPAGFVTNLDLTSGDWPVGGFFDTNKTFFVVSEGYRTSIGEHQKDTAREGWATVQKAAALVGKMRPVMYAGLVLILAALAMSYFQAKYPAVFSPGLKIIALTFCTGLVLTILPTMTQNNGVLMAALVGGVVVLLVYIFGKKLSEKTEGKTS